MLGIIIGVGAVITMVAIGQGSKESIQSGLSSMGSNMITVSPASNINGGVRIAGTSFQTLTAKDIEALKRSAKYITDLSPSVTSRGQAINGALNWPTQMQGVSPDYMDIRKLTLKDGIVFTNAVTLVEMLMDSVGNQLDVDSTQVVFFFVSYNILFINFRSKLESFFLQSLQHLKLLEWFHLDCMEITEMPYI